MIFCLIWGLKQTWNKMISKPVKKNRIEPKYIQKNFTEDTTGMEATGIEVTMDFHMDMDIMPTADVLTAMAGPMVLTTALDLMFMANRNFINKKN
jgi:hypothetical protein